MNHSSRQFFVAAFLLTSFSMPWPLLAQSTTEEGPAKAPESSDTPVESEIATGFSEKPRWEFGVGGGFFQGFDYPGSEDPNQRGIALPFLIYRTERLRVGGGGARAVAVEQPRFRLDFSFGGGTSSSSESDGVRAGLPDLDFLIEFGPRLQWILVNEETDDGGRLQVTAAGAVRGIISTDFSEVDGQGVLLELSLSAGRRRIFGSDVDLFARVASTWTDDRLHEFYYEVAPEFVTPDRPAFDATGGYLETQIFLGGAYRVTRSFRAFAGVQVGLFNGAANEDSPLFETTSSTGFALGFAWTLATSKHNVRLVDVEP